MTQRAVESLEHLVAQFDDLGKLFASERPRDIVPSGGEIGYRSSHHLTRLQTEVIEASAFR